MNRINTIVYEGKLGFDTVQYTYTDICTSVGELKSGYFEFVNRSKTNHIVDNKYVYLLDGIHPLEEVTVSKIGSVLFMKSERWNVEYIDWKYIHDCNHMESEYSVVKYLEHLFNAHNETNIKFNIIGEDAYGIPIVINPHYCIADGKGGGGNPLAETVFTIFSDPENVLRLIDLLGSAFDSIVIEFFKVTMNIVENHSELYKELNPFVIYLFDHIKGDLYDLPYEMIKGKMIFEFTKQFLNRKQEK